jgi:predicted HicB family RNase H-like nuclease
MYDKKLTLTLDPEIIEMAKQYASRKGVSLSSLVEQYFKFLVREEEE